MVEELNLKCPIYRKTSNFGFIGKDDPNFTWEKPKLRLIGIPEQI
jgi:S-adenosylmethionine synthetase